MGYSVATACSDSFTETLSVEKQGMRDMLPWFDATYDRRVVRTDKGREWERLQEDIGDVVVNDLHGNAWPTECKTDNTDHPNAFLEVWSNLEFCRPKVGWMFTPGRRLMLCYYFLKTKQLYRIDMQALWVWVFGKFADGQRIHPARIYAFQEKPQRLREQLNQSVGRCVPITTIQKEVGFSHYDLSTPAYTRTDYGELAEDFKLAG